jgi:hypothetical protein
MVIDGNMQTSWFTEKPQLGLAEMDIDRFAMPLSVAQDLEEIRIKMGQRAGRSIRPEELVRAALEQFLDANAAMLGKPVAVPPAIPSGDDLEARARRTFLGMIP